MENRDMNLFDFVLLCWKAFVRLMTKAGLLVLQTVKLCLVYCWIVIPCAVVGLLAGWIWAKPSMTMFENNATIMYAEGMRDVVQQGIVDFLNLTKEEKIDLGLTEEILDDLDRLDMYNVIDCNADSVPDFVDKKRSVSYSDTLNLILRDRTHLVVKVRGHWKLEPFETALTNFLCTKDYLVEADKKYKKIQKERLDYFTKEVARLDSFSTYDYFMRPRYLGIDKWSHIVSEREQELYYEDMMIVMKNKNYVEEQMMSTPNVVNFRTPFVAYAMPPIFKYAIGLFVGGVVGLLLALLVKFRAVVIAFMKE